MAEEIKEEIKEEVTTEEAENQTENAADTAETVEEFEQPTAEIELADGTVISGLVVNGDNLVSTEDISEKLTQANLIGVKINGVNAGALKLAGYKQRPDGYHFVLLEKKQQELEIERLSAKLDYLAIMTDVEVE